MEKIIHIHINYIDFEELLEKKWENPRIGERGAVSNNRNRPIKLKANFSYFFLTLILTNRIYDKTISQSNLQFGVKLPHIPLNFKKITRFENNGIRQENLP